MSRFDLTTFTISELLTCADELKQNTQGSDDLEKVASKVVHYFYDSLGDPNSGRACVLARFYTTIQYVHLPIILKGVVRTVLEKEHFPDDMKCLTLLGTVGDKQDWNSRKTSVGHQVIPLLSSEIVTKLPMIAQLMQQFGLDIGSFLANSPDLMMTPKRTYNVFYVPEALASPHVPAQSDFVIPMNIHSVVGFGGLLPSGNLFAVILFSKVFITKDVAEMFKTLALTIRGLALPYDHKAVFAPRKKG